MEQSLEVRTQRLLQISIDLHNQMAETQKLREMVRSAEAAERRQEPAHPVIIAQPVGNELHV
ncbi:hypothetical protein [Bradyrhizobium sp. AZCC 1721]|uniref:hypothetical protein n=1 Tax=Bradyrhizobium sp. AZCC 1721 TaxID=3117016 RepID=UPI002FF3AEDB